VFVFGEQESKRKTQRDPIDSNLKIRKNMTISIAENAPESALLPYAMTSKVNDIRAKRGTQFHLSSGQNLLHSIRQDGSVTSFDAQSMIANN